MGSDDLLIVAGEASGDLHGERLVGELRRRRPELRFFGLGSSRMAAAGVECVADAATISAVGLAEVLRVVPRARRIFRRLLDQVEQRRPRLAVLIDFPEFNLRLAKQLRRRGVPVVYYVSPQVWAWRRGRVYAIARDVERMLVFFPFEREFYRGHDVKVAHVGHPLVDEVPELPSAWDQGPPSADEPWRLALLPGSRQSEVRRLLPVMVGAVDLLAQRHRLRVRLLLAPTIPVETVAPLLAASRTAIEVIPEDRFEVLADSHLALCASGTATLETGLLGTPMLVVYRLGLVTYWMGRLLVRLPHISLVNLVLGARVVPELLQGDASPESIARHIERWVEDPEAIAAVRSRLREVRPLLGASGATGRAADQVLELWNEAESAGRP